MYRIFTLFLGLLLTQVAEAQINISGHITDKQNKPLKAVIITIRNIKDSVVIASTATDSLGSYTIQATVPDVLIQAKADGYNDEMGSIDTAKNFQTIDLMLHEKIDKKLGQVTVTSKKAIIEYKADRTIFNVENSISAAGGDALEVLKKTPGVLVANNQVTIAGKSSAAIMVNGRLQQLSGDDLIQFLRSIPADNLSKVEVITSPNAKYDAEGNMGIINLVTKKNLKKGLKGSATANYKRNSYNWGGASVALNYRQDKLNLFCNVNGGKQGYQYTALATTYYPDHTNEQKVANGNFNTYARIQVGGDYALSKRSVIGFSFNEAYNVQDNTEDIRSVNFDEAGQSDSTLVTGGKTHDVYAGKHTLNINYELKLDTSGKKLNIDADYYTHKGDKNRNYLNASFDDEDQLMNLSLHRLTSDPEISIRSVKADVEYPLKIAKFTFGAKAVMTTNSADNLYEIYDGDVYVTDGTQSNAFRYEEQIQALYATVQKTIQKLEFNIGLRAEHTYAKGYSKTLAQTNVQEYTKLFPSGSLQYTLNKNHILSATFSRRINRPGYNHLNPFRFYYTPNSYWEGNPDLQPSFNYIMELGYNLKQNYFFKILYNRNTNYWDRIFTIDSIQQTSSISRMNIGDTRFFGFAVNASFQPAKWVEVRGSLNGGYNTFLPKQSASVRSYSGYNAWIELGGTFYLNKKKTLSAELNGYYYTPRQQDYKRWESISCINAGIRYMMLNRNLIITLNADDLLAKSYWLQTNQLNGTREYSYDDERSVRLAVTYKFGNKNVRGKRDRGSLEEIQRANTL